MLPQIIYILSRLTVVLALGGGPDGPLNMERMNLSDLIAATGGQPAACDPSALAFHRVSIDSRTVESGDLFWALRGERHDGHDFVPEAIRRGAVACVVEDNKLISGEVPRVALANTQQGLQQFARWYRSQMDALVVGVTGTVGKTTTREMIHSVLSAAFEGCRSPKNFNNHVGLPLSILQIDRQHEFAVLEMGASRLGEIRELSQTAAPEFGAVTRIGVAHLEGFGSVESIVQAKGELIDSLPASGFAILNGDDPRCRSLGRRARCRVIEVGQNIGNAVRASHVECTADELAFRVDGNTFRVRAAGRHHLNAALVALAIAREVGLTPAQIAEGLNLFVPVAGRCQVQRLGAWTVINDTYNANPSSLEAACDLLHDWKPAAQRILVVGDMCELGEQAVAWHRTAGNMAARAGADRLIAFGQHAVDVTLGALEGGMTSDNIAQCDDLDVVFAVLDCWTAPGDVVLVKGSRSMRMERVTEWLIEQTKTNTETYIPRDGARACA